MLHATRMASHFLYKDIQITLKPSMEYLTQTHEQKFYKTRLK